MLAFRKLSKHPQLITVDAQATIRDTLQLMHEHNVLSLPVIKSATVTGFVDMFDVLSYLIEKWDEFMVNTQSHPERTLHSLFALDQMFLQHPVSDLPDRSDNNLFATVAEEERASRLLKLYGLGVHRVALINMKGDVRTVISQSDLITFFNNNKHLFGALGGKSVQELGLVKPNEVILLDANQTAISAFKLLANHNISGAPIVNSQGTIAGTLSISDLRGLRKDPLSMLLQPLRDFKEIGEAGMANVICYPHDTLSHVLTLLAGTQLHRVWVVDEEHRPISVMSLTTICDYVANLCMK
jgi:CBS-domain-containing membrane protein